MRASGLNYSSNNTIAENNITANNHGIWGDQSSGNDVSGNKIAYNGNGIVLSSSDGNSIGNNITANNWDGIVLPYYSSGNSVSGNNITANNFIGILLGFSSSNRIYHNNFIGNTYQAYTCYSADIWDDGYPSGGNYWCDYTTRYPDAQELDDSGIGDTPYVIDENNKDNYPLMKLWSPTSPAVMAGVDIDPDTLNLRSKGQWITAYIQVPEGYNTIDMDATTVLLNGTISPVLDPKYDFVTDPGEYLVDHNGDGILERMVKFNRTIVSSLMVSSGIWYGHVTLAVIGQLDDGIPFEGSDKIVVRMLGDANSDGKVDALDLYDLGKADGSTPDNAHWNPNCDFNEDSKVDTSDLRDLVANYGRMFP